MGKIAFVFAGQGAQRVGMGLDLFENHPAAAALFDLLDEKLKKILREGPAGELNMTLNTQPCIFALDLACAMLLGEAGVAASAAAGFSLGEIPALAYCGILSRSEAYSLVLRRAAAMHSAAEDNPGAMFAVLRLPAPLVGEICSAVGEAYAVNYNCPGQTVVACRRGREEALEAEVTAHGGRALRLPVGGGFHSPMMSAASDEIREYLAGVPFGEMKIPLWSNVTGEIYSGDPRELIARQISSPVLWQRSVESMIESGIDRFVELGPGSVLSGLIRKINAGVKIYNVCDRESLLRTVGELKNA